MPWTPAQVAFFRSAMHDPKIAAAHGMTEAKARQLWSEDPKGTRKPISKKGSILSAHRIR